MKKAEASPCFPLPDPDAPKEDQENATGPSQTGTRERAHPRLLLTSRTLFLARRSSARWRNSVPWRSSRRIGPFPGPGAA